MILNVHCPQYLPVGVGVWFIEIFFGAMVPASIGLMVGLFPTSLHTPLRALQPLPLCKRKRFFTSLSQNAPRFTSGMNATLNKYRRRAILQLAKTPGSAGFNAPSAPRGDSRADVFTF